MLLSNSGSDGARTAILLHPVERGVSSKTGEYESSLVFDLPRHQPLVAVIAGLVATRPGNEPLVPGSYERLAQVFGKAAKRCGAGVLSPVPYSLRHSGASNDAYDAERDMRSIKKRGRWRSESSVRRYEKGSLLSREAAKLSKKVLQRGRDAEGSIGMVLAGLWKG